MHQAKRPTANGDRRLLTVVQLLGAMPKLAMIWRLQDAERRRERGALQEGLRNQHVTSNAKFEQLGVWPLFSAHADGERTEPALPPL